MALYVVQTLLEDKQENAGAPDIRSGHLTPTLTFISSSLLLFPLTLMHAGLLAVL